MALVALSSNFIQVVSLTFLNALQQLIQIVGKALRDPRIFLGLLDQLNRFLLLVLNGVSQVVDLALDALDGDFDLLVLVDDDVAFVFVEALHAFAVVVGCKHSHLQLLVFLSGLLFDPEDYAFLLG